MPNVTIEVCRDYACEEEASLIDAVHRAMMKALRIPEWDRTIRLLVYESSRFAIPPAMTDRYTLINIDLFVGRSIEAKRSLYRAIVEGFSELGILPDHVKILLRESPKENWGIRGGVPASEVDLGFKVEV